MTKFNGDSAAVVSSDWLNVSNRLQRQEFKGKKMLQGFVKNVMLNLIFPTSAFAKTTLMKVRTDVIEK